MVFTLENIATYIAIVMFAVGTVKALIVSPLQKEIDSLRVAIDKLSASIELIDNKVTDIKERVVVVEESAKQAHKRIDTLEDRIADRTARNDA